MRLTCCALVAVVASAVVPAYGQGAEEAAVNKRVEGLYAAMAKGNVKAYVASWDENAVRAKGTNIVVGRANLEKDVTEAFRHGGAPIKFTRHATRLLSPTTALVHGATEDASTNPATKGHTMITLVKKGNEWLVAGLQTGAARPP